MKRNALDVPCSFCIAQPGQRCTNNALRHKPPLEHFEAHEIRTRDAERASTLADDNNDDDEELF